LQDVQYDYRPDGNVRVSRDWVRGVYQGFEYDSLRRLRRWMATDNAGNAGAVPPWEVSWSYDDRGNLTGRTARSEVYGNQTITNVYPTAGQARPHGIVSSSLWAGEEFAYDAVGNVTTHPQGGLIDYNAFNLPKRISGGPQPMAYRYDAFGGRVLKQAVDGAGQWQGGVRSVYVGGVFERRWGADGDLDVFYVRSPERVWRRCSARRAAGRSRRRICTRIGGGGGGE
jgi:NADH:ubiquinone oxidoreductase subunit